MIQDIGRLWFAPGALFRSIRERPRSKGVLIVLLVVVALATLLVLDIVMEEASQRGLDAIQERGGDGAAGMKAMEHPAMKALVVVAAPVSLLLFLLVFSGASYLFLQLTGGTEEEKGFAALFRAAAWAKAVDIPRMVLWVPLVLVQRSPEVYFGPAALLPAESRGALFAALSALDLFSIWFLVLFVLGARICLKLTTSRAVLVVVAPWFLWNLLKVVKELAL